MEDGIEQNMSLLLNELDILKEKNLNNSNIKTNINTNINTNMNTNTNISTKSNRSNDFYINKTKEPFSWCVKDS